MERRDRPQIELSTPLSATQADAWLQALLTEIPWRQDHLRLYGRAQPLPRLTCWMGDPGTAYTYSGIRNEPVPWMAPVTAIRTRVEAATGERYSSVLLNLYRDGRDHMGWHADDEPEVDPSVGIASLSLGAQRRFQVKPRDGSSRALSLPLEHGSLLWMPPGFQQRWLHRVPKDPQEAAPRVNLTFRMTRAAG